mmetsp:Transcript_60707/g.163481  ORF Transcript_60707/g.163481 Transcript_60707/m.163481 type:complete len:237 (+) Transcript_60707:800-1510(+)
MLAEKAVAKGKARASSTRAKARAKKKERGKARAGAAAGTGKAAGTSKTTAMPPKAPDPNTCWCPRHWLRWWQTVCLSRRPSAIRALRPSGCRRTGSGPEACAGFSSGVSATMATGASTSTRATPANLPSPTHRRWAPAPAPAAPPSATPRRWVAARRRGGRCRRRWRTGLARDPSRRQMRAAAVRHGSGRPSCGRQGSCRSACGGTGYCGGCCGRRWTASTRRSSSVSATSWTRTF